MSKNNDLTTAIQNDMIKELYNVRDKMNKEAQKITRDALSDWNNNAPVKTGTLRDSGYNRQYGNGKGISVFAIDWSGTSTGNRGMVVNIINNRGRWAGNYTRFLARYNAKWINKANSIK